MSGGGKKSGPKKIPAEATKLEDPVVFYKKVTGVYPSNAQVWWAYKRPPEPGTEEPPKLYLEVFDPSIRFQFSKGNTKVSKGHYLLNEFSQDRSGASGIAGLSAVETQARPSVCAFFAGRVFYAGVNSVGFNTKIYYSQVLEEPKQAQFCFQQQDPTSEDFRDLLPTDGGVIQIPGVAEVFFMKALGQSLFVFASNGVWEISGSEGLGFTAVDYSVNQLSEIPSLSGLSFVEVEGTIMWWNRSGVYHLFKNQVGSYQITSLSDQTIRSFYEKIPDLSKVYAKGLYNPATKRVQWFYRATKDAPPATYDKSLLFDTQLGAWFPFSLSTSEDLFVKGGCVTQGYLAGLEEDFVFVENDEVFFGVDEVVSNVIQKSLASSVVKYTCLSSLFEVFFAEERRDDYVDWADAGAPNSYSSFFTTGYNVLAEGNKAFQSNYVTVNYTPMLQGSAYIQGLWDYAEEGGTGRWSSKQQIYSNSDLRYSNRMRKLKIRGQGNALQMKIESEEGKPFSINGWTLSASSNAGV